MTDAQLTTAANTIKNETNAGSNSATRLGDMFLSLIDNKLNADKVVTTIGTTDTKVPSEKAVSDALATKQNSLGFTPENVSNKSTNVTSDAASDVKFPSVKAVKTYVDAAVAGGGGSSTVTTVKVSLTSAEILDLATNPKVLIAAQGAGKLIQVNFVTMRLNFGSAPYVGGTLRVRYATGGTPILSNSSHTNSSSIIFNPALSGTQVFADTAANVNVFLDSSGSITNGDGTLDVYITYTVITL